MGIDHRRNEREIGIIKICKCINELKRQLKKDTWERKMWRYWESLRIRVNYLRDELNEVI